MLITYTLHFVRFFCYFYTTGVVACYLQASQAKNINSVNVKFWENFIKKEWKIDPTSFEKIYNLIFILSAAECLRILWATCAWDVTNNIFLLHVMY